MALSNDQILWIYVEVQNGRDNHGDFLRSFADAVCRADGENFMLLRQAAVFFIIKYNLQEYLDGYTNDAVSGTGTGGGDERKDAGAPRS